MGQSEGSPSKETLLSHLPFQSCLFYTLTKRKRGHSFHLFFHGALPWNGKTFIRKGRNRNIAVGSEKRNGQLLWGISLNLVVPKYVLSTQIEENLTQLLYYIK